MEQNRKEKAKIKLIRRNKWIAIRDQKTWRESQARR